MSTLKPFVEKRVESCTLKFGSSFWACSCAVLLIKKLFCTCVHNLHFKKYKISYLLLYYRPTIVLVSFKHEQDSDCNVYFFSLRLYKMTEQPPTFNHSPKLGSWRFYFIQAIFTKAFVSYFYHSRFTKIIIEINILNVEYKSEWNLPM